MPKLVSKDMAIHRFQEAFAFQFRVDQETIWRRFRDRFRDDLRSILGSWGGLGLWGAKIEF